ANPSRRRVVQVHRADAAQDGTEPTDADTTRVGQRHGVEPHRCRAEQPQPGRALLSLAGGTDADRAGAATVVGADRAHDEPDHGAHSRARDQDPDRRERAPGTPSTSAHRAVQLATPCGRSDALLELLELVDRHQDGPGLRALGRSDDTPSFQEVHEPAGAGEPYPQLALEHARRAEPAPHDPPGRPGGQVAALAPVAAGAAAAGVVTGDALDVVRLGVLPPPVGDEPVDALLVDPRALDAPRPTRRRGDEQHVALTDQLVGARLVEDHA